MRIAILSAVRESWNNAPALMNELRTALTNWTELEASVWLIDDAAADAPESWHSLAGEGSDLHVLALQGRQGRDRALTTALGYLLFEREESFDTFLLLDLNRPQDARRLEPLFEAALRHPGHVVIAPGGPRRKGPFARLGFRAKRALLRAFSGEHVPQSPALILPVHAAEALCHESYGASHVEAALRKLRLPVMTAPMPKGACGLNAIAAASVFRDQVFARSFHAAAWVFTAGLLAAGVAIGFRSFGHAPASPLLWIGPLFLAAFAGLAALASFLFGVFNQSLSEIRRWTPALDAPLLVQSVTRVKRQPYAVARSSP